ncbi:DUF2505 domain-containing protein [Mycobacterium sherrisii]|uniref:DUF2505 domain-containing protein n=1 Tax=Mycobacterium sherrisii TaxID=243061 RepID=UPI003975EF28
MPRSFDVLTESPASVEQIHAAFSSEDYWLARIAIGDASTTLDSLTVGPDGAVAVQVTQHVGRALLPSMVTKFAPADLKLVHSETWQPAGDGQVRGQVNVTTSPKVGSGRADAWLAPIDTGTQLRFAEVEVKIPLVGGKLEKSLGASLAESIPAVQRFTTTWIADHC